MGARTRTLNEFGTRPATRADKPTRHSISRLAKNQKRDAPLKESSRDGSGLLLIRVLLEKKGFGTPPLPPPNNRTLFVAVALRDLLLLGHTSTSARRSLLRRAVVACAALPFACYSAYRSFVARLCQKRHQLLSTSLKSYRFYGD